jgi:hypothetical protein
MSTAQALRKSCEAMPLSEPIVKTPKLSLVSPSEENSGICAICQYAPTCIYLPADDQPVLMCEMFEGSVRKDTPPPTTRILSFTTSARIAEKDSFEYLGLCASCRKRETCLYPKSEGGVWRCEEYE